MFANSIYSIRQLAESDSKAKVIYRFLQNDNVGESDIIKNMSSNCVSCVRDKPVLGTQDTSEINLYNHRNRIRKGQYIDTTNARVGRLVFYIHPRFILDSETLMSYGFSNVKIWNRGYEKLNKDHPHKNKLAPIQEKESYKWIESSIESKEVLKLAIRCYRQAILFCWKVLHLFFKLC